LQEPGLLGISLSSPACRLSAQDISLEGPVALRAEIDLASPERAGAVEIDATGASVAYANGIQKASGRGATLSFRIERLVDRRYVLEDLRLSVTAFAAEIRPGDSDARPAE
jgi:hypothetical protein